MLAILKVQRGIRQAAILCGGRGTRLGSLTREVPKPLLEVGGTSFLEILIRELADQGVTHFLLLAAFEAPQIERFAAKLPGTLGIDIDIAVSIEPDQAGTGGALWHARHRLEDSFYLCNGDSWFDVPLDHLAALLERRPAALGSIALRELPAGGRYGVVSLAGEIVTAFGESDPARAPALINGGVYAFRREVVDQLAPTGSLEGDTLPSLAAAGKLTGFVDDAFFLDIGVPDDFARAQRDIPAHRRARPDRRHTV